MPWTKGQSGNPGGRPGVIKDIQELARKHSIGSILTLVEIRDDKASPAAARVQAASAILDRGYGKPPQHLEGDIRQHHIVTDRPETDDEWARRHSVEASERPSTLPH
jgi:hypothetical protein